MHCPITEFITSVVLMVSALNRHLSQSQKINKEKIDR